jgi:NAD(P)-dependent dehydrogenase (short-subunit alcohol dehydrogenase family)
MSSPTRHVGPESDYDRRMSCALIVGASTGIGRALAQQLIEDGWSVIGLARRPSTLSHPRYRHCIGDVRAHNYRDVLAALLAEAPCEGRLDVCVYAAGIGEPLDLANLAIDGEVFAVNLTGAVITAEVVLPSMVAARAGHFVGLSSQADRLIDEFAPSYAASKAGLSSYLEGLALACRPHGVAVTNARFGFVATEMSRHAEVRPFLISAEHAAIQLQGCLRRRPIRFTYPRRTALLLWLVGWPRRVRLWLA